MTKIYIILQHTGEYSDYRCSPMFWVDAEDVAKKFIELATETARSLHVEFQKLQEQQETVEYESRAYKKLEKKISELKSPFDEGLTGYQFGDVSYSFSLLERYQPQ